MQDSSRVKRNAEGKQRAADVIAFIEKLTVPSGKGQGSPFRLRQWQKRFIRDIYEPHLGKKRVVRRAILSMARKNGKCLELQTPIATPNGWTTLGRLRVGDQVFDERGKPCNVTYVSPVFVGRRCWRLRFADGSTIVADDEHRWITRHSYRPWKPQQRPTWRNASGRGGRWYSDVVTTRQIAESVLRPRTDGVREHNHKLLVAGALELPPVNLPIPPYVLGYWLGNGHSAAAIVTLAQSDTMQIGSEIESELGFAWKAKGQSSGNAPQFGLSRGNRHNRDRAASVQHGLRHLGVLGDKHIPEMYLWASREQRLALLQGLMDSDGTSSNHASRHGGSPRCYFDVMNERLARGALALVRSLGFKATIREDVATLHGRAIGPCWSISFNAYREDLPFRLPRKLERLTPRPGKPSRSSSNAIVACDEVPSVPTMCIQVDSPSHLFLAGEGLTPTHNTGLIAAIALAHLVGPEAVLHGEIYSAANDREQASIVFKFARQFVELEPELRDKIEIIQSTKTMLARATGSIYRAVSAEAGTKHGFLPSVVIYDELAQAKNRDLYDVLDTSFGATEEPLFITISTQSNDPEHILSKLIDDGLSGTDHTICCHLYAADEGCDLDDEAQWHKANPALADFRDFDDLAAAIRKAQRLPAEEPKVRNLLLNQRVSPSASLISRAEWMGCAGDARLMDREEVFAGLDLSSIIDLTALAVGSVADPARVQVYFWKPADLLLDHSARDFGTGDRRYEQWVRARHMFTSPGRSIDPAVVALFIAKELVLRYKIRGLAYDRWRIDDLLREFDRVGLAAYKDGEKGDGLRLVPWGQGFKDMGPAIDALEKSILERKLVHGGNPVLNWNMANAIATMDPAGNRKLDKEKARFRIDGAVALAMMMGLRSRDRAKQIDISTLIA